VTFQVLGTEELAEKLGTTPNAARIRLQRARQALRTLIDREERVAIHRAREMESLRRTTPACRASHPQRAGRVALPRER